MHCGRLLTSALKALISHLSNLCYCFRLRTVANFFCFLSPKAGTLPLALTYKRLTVLVSGTLGLDMLTWI